MEIKTQIVNSRGELFETIYKEYIKWGEIGDHLVTRALEMKDLVK